MEHETESEGLKHLAEKTLAACLAQAEAIRDSDPEEAREITGIALAASALKFPDLHARLQALQDSLAETARSTTAGDGPAK